MPRAWHRRRACTQAGVGQKYGLLLNLVIRVHELVWRTSWSLACRLEHRRHHAAEIFFVRACAGAETCSLQTLCVVTGWRLPMSQVWEQPGG
jgi:hypothetical protein